jgi:selenocysteine-specific elongation factor
MIVATAGHIDHGKTVLVKALTGIDTDRLPEEKRRGISIDLGFAYHPMAGGGIIGFVDVPGHERFIRNMLAGVTGIDFALLVVAADDGPMPQTREHLAILDLLGVAGGAVALTKTDRVPAARVAEAAADIEALLAGTVLAGATIFPVSGLTGDGIAALSRHLEDAAQNMAARRIHGNFRLAIDRSFTVPGAGMVVTGAVFAGAVHMGDRLVLSPAGIPVRVRGIHAQNQSADDGVAGERCALNIAGADLRRVEIHRGDWLVADAAHAPTARLDARIRLLPVEGRALSHWTPVHVHLGAVEVPGRVAVLDGTPIAPGASGLVQLVLDHPIGALHGDRLILRDQSARRTMAGGIVIDPMAPGRGRARPERLAALAALERPTPADALAGLLALLPDGVALHPFAQGHNLTGDEAAALWDGADMVRAGAGDDAVGFGPDHWRALGRATVETLARAHERRAEQAGLDETALRNAVRRRMAPPVFAAVVANLVKSGELARDGPILRLPGHRAAMADADAALWRRVQPPLEAGGLRPPSVRELADKLGQDPTRMERFLVRAARFGLVVRVAGNRFFPPAALRQLGEMAEALVAADAERRFTAAGLRDASGIGRNLAIEVVEYFDRAGFTRRIGNERRILKPAAEVF